jgi:hypothetical protein
MVTARAKVTTGASNENTLKAVPTKAETVTATSLKTAVPLKQETDVIAVHEVVQQTLLEEELENETVGEKLVPPNSRPLIVRSGPPEIGTFRPGVKLTTGASKVSASEFGKPFPDVPTRAATVTCITPS